MISKSRERIGIIVQARMGSTRLPGKVMKQIMGKPMIYYLIERLKRIRLVDEIIIATADGEENDPIVEYSKSMGVKGFRGSEDNVLSRYYQAARIYQLDVIVRITSDCPLIDPDISNAVIQHFLDHQPMEYVSNTIKRIFPRGMDTEVFSFNVLKEAFEYADKPYQKEHVVPFILENKKLLNYGNNKEDQSHFRLTVDTAEDFQLIEEIYNNLYRNNPNFDLVDIITLLEKKPELFKINQHVEQKELER